MDEGELRAQLQAALVQEIRQMLGASDEAQLQRVCKAIAAAVARVLAPRIV